MPKGVYKHKEFSKKRKLKHSLMAKSKGFGKWNKGHVGYFKGKKLSIAHKQKISNSLKGTIPWTKGKFGKKHPRWKGSRSINTQGYVEIYKFNHPFKNYKHHVLEHRLVMEKSLGRYLNPKEVVHHRGIKYPLGSIKNKQDNRIENLQLFANEKEHRKFHHKNSSPK